jgi:PAS domain S-box-containing protein
MNWRNKTKDELIKELQKLRQEYDLLKESYEKGLTERKLTTDKLSESEKHYHTLFNSIDEGFCIIEVIFDDNEKPVDFRFLEINPSFEKQTGLINVQGKRMRELAPKLEEYWFEIFGKIALTGQPLHFENIAEQLHRWYDVYAFRFGQSENRQVAVLFNDITEHKRTEEALKESEERYRLLYESSLDAILLTSPDGNIYSANEAACTMFRRTEEDICKTGRNGLVDLSDPRLPVLIEERSQKGRTVGGLTMIRKDGTKFQTELTSSVFSNKDGQPRTSMIIRDITTRKFAENKLIESEERYHSLFNVIEEGMAINEIVLDENGDVVDYIILAVNPAFSKQTIYSNVQVIGRRATDIYEVSTAYIRNWWKSHSKMDGVARTELYHKPSRRWFNITTTPPDGKRFVTIFMDITNRKKAETELKKSQRKLRKLAAHLEEIRENERSRIALNLHDDIGQKLTAMNLEIAWVKSRMGVQSPVVKNKLENINLLIKETFANIREISSDLRPSILFDFGLIEAVRLQLKKFGDISGIKYSFDYDPVEFKIDTQLSLVIYRILQESLTNIIRHSHASFTEIRLNLINDKVEMIIRDNGKGIEEEKINSLKSMGIAGINERVKSVSGKLDIEGKKGAGTTVKVSIPIKNIKKHD